MNYLYAQMTYHFVYITLNNIIDLIYKQMVNKRIYENSVGIPEERLQQLMSEKTARIDFTNPLKKFKLMKNGSMCIYSEE